MNMNISLGGKVELNKKTGNKFFGVQCVFIDAEKYGKPINNKFHPAFNGKSFKIIWDLGCWDFVSFEVAQDEKLGEIVSRFEENYKEFGFRVRGLMVNGTAKLIFPTFKEKVIHDVVEVIFGENGAFKNYLILSSYIVDENSNEKVEVPPIRLKIAKETPKPVEE